jgi:glycosyltransferase involved in cell wall biosynthesis
MKNPNITAIVTFHREGRLAHVSLNSIARTRAAIENDGVSVETIYVLDCADDLTDHFVKKHPARRQQDLIMEVGYGDLSASRNAGIAKASGSCIAIFDGDDLYSEKWLVQAYASYQEDGARHIYHPEIIVSFDAVQNYNFEVDQRSKQFDPLNLLMTNYWCSCSFASRQTYLDYPYVPKESVDSGFGFEDWHWNCETVAAGIEHRIVPETALFYRRKRLGSLGSTDRAAFRVIRPTRLFSLHSNPHNKAD